MKRLRIQLVALLVSVALLPALFAIPTVSSLLDRSLGSGLNARVVAGLDAGLTSTRALLEYEKEDFERDWRDPSEWTAAPAFEELSAAPPELVEQMAETTLSSLQQAQEPTRETLPDATITSAKPAAGPVAGTTSAGTTLDGASRTGTETALAAAAQVSARRLLRGPERVGIHLAALATRPVMPTISGSVSGPAAAPGIGSNGRQQHTSPRSNSGPESGFENAVVETLWIRRALPADLAARADTLSTALVLAQSVQHERAHLLRAFLATFLVVNALFVVLVIAFGLFLANRLTRPLEALASGMTSVAGGDLTVRLPAARHGAIEQLTMNFNEMTSRLRSQQADLVRLEKEAAWRDMARRLAHEVKNPLTPIQLAADEIRNAFPGGDPGYQALLDEGTNIIREEVDRLRRLVQEFSRFARLPEPRWETIDAASLLSAISALYGPERVHVLLPSSSFKVECDSEQLHRLLVNLVNNALEAQERSGVTAPIEVEIRQEESNGIRIEVSDRGPGVPMSERERVFEPGVTGRTDGMGLGLAIARSIAALHDGRISIADRDAGGAIFVVVFPASRNNSV